MQKYYMKYYYFYVSIQKKNYIMIYVVNCLLCIYKKLKKIILIVKQ